MDFVGPFTYNAVRFALGALSLVPLLLIFRPDRTGTEDEHREQPAGTEDEREARPGTEDVGGARTESLADAAARARRRNRLRFLRDGERVGSIYNDDGTSRTMARLTTAREGSDFISVEVPKGFVDDRLDAAVEADRVTDEAAAEGYRLRVL